MLQRFKKVLAAACVFTLILSVLPQPVSAVTNPEFAKVYTKLFENGAKDGVFPYTIKNLTAGQTVIWSLSGTGAGYATLAQTTTKVTSKRVTNTVTIQTNGDSAAKNKLVNVTAKIYEKDGKLKTILSSGDARIKIIPTSIEAVGTSLPSTLLIGTSYQLNYRIAPANATCSVIWTAAHSDGTDASDCITNAGRFTPKKEGTYTVSVRAMNGATLRASSSINVKVGNSIIEAKQVTTNQLVAIYSTDARALVKRENFVLKNAYGLSETLKDVQFSEDGTQVTITTYAPLRNNETYTLTDGTSTLSITAKVGKPVRLTLLTKTATVNKLTPLTYAIYDAEGVDVTASYPGYIQWSPQITNGYLKLDTGEVYMTKINDIGTIQMIYTFYDTTIQPLMSTGTLVCIAPIPSGKTNFTISSTPNIPNYGSPSYADTRKLSEGENCYLHFRALDVEGTELPYDSVTFTSYDPDKLVINNSGTGIARATAVRAGTVSVLVRASYGGQIYTYSYVVEIAPPSYLTTIIADKSVLYTSNQYPAGYKQYINLTAYNQNGQSYSLTNESAQFTNSNSYAPNLVAYDTVTNRIEITPGGCPTGTYSYTLMLTANGRSASLFFTIVVQAPPTAGTVTYQIDIDNPVLNLSPDTDAVASTFATDKAITIRLAEYRGGIFYGYYNIQSVRVIKDGMYYFNDLTLPPVQSGVDIFALENNSLNPRVVLNTVSLNGYLYQKAAAGKYNVELRYTPRGSASTLLQTASFELTDNQTFTPTVTVTRTVASTICNTALALARNCLGTSSGEIVDCTVTGSTNSGSLYTLQAGESVNIKSVTVRVSSVVAGGQTLSYDIVVDVGRTLTNL